MNSEKPLVGEERIREKGLGSRVCLVAGSLDSKYQQVGATFYLLAPQALTEMLLKVTIDVHKFNLGDWKHGSKERQGIDKPCKTGVIGYPLYN